MKLNMPPVGKYAITGNDSCSHIAWSPGNSTKYQMVVSELPHTIRDEMGGDMMVSIRSMKAGSTMFVSYAIPDSTLLFDSFIAEKFGEHAGSPEDLAMLTCLLNWALCEDRVCHDYAQEVWDKSQKIWKSVRKT